MDDELGSEDAFPYIIRSRTVTRLLPEPIFPHPPLTNPEKRYGPEFWDRLMRQPSVYKTESPGLMSSYQTQRKDAKWDTLPPPVLETLPPPSEVFRRKKRKKSYAERSVISVENHIQELKKKQSSIDKLKTMKWGGYKVYEVGNKEEIQSDGGRADQERDTFFRADQGRDTFFRADQGRDTFFRVDQERDSFFQADQERQTFFRVDQEQDTFFRVDQEQDTFFRVDQEQDTFFRVDQEQDTFFRVDQERDTFFRADQERDTVFRVDQERDTFFRADQERDTFFCADKKQDTFFSFLDDEDGCSVQDMSIFSFSSASPQSPGGVVFPWMSPREDASTCYLDRTYEGRGASRGSFL